MEPQGGIASTIHESTGFIETIGLWYLLIFVLLPLFSKRGRGWIKKFADIRNTVSQTDIDALDEKQDIKIKELEESIKKLLK